MKFVLKLVFNYVMMKSTTLGDDSQIRFRRNLSSDFPIYSTNPSFYITKNCHEPLVGPASYSPSCSLAWFPETSAHRLLSLKNSYVTLMDKNLILIVSSSFKVVNSVMKINDLGLWGPETNKVSDRRLLNIISVSKIYSYKSIC